MTLQPGTRLGPYEIQSALGAGGMGEVYRARDTRLDRTVAIKVLPEILAADPQFRERFDREARVISSLDHPHICALYDVGEQQGTAFLVMQYLEGETLAERLGRTSSDVGRALSGSPGGPDKIRPTKFPVEEALQIAIQIARRGCHDTTVKCEGAKVRRCEGAKVRRCEGAKDDSATVRRCVRWCEV